MFAKRLSKIQQQGSRCFTLLGQILIHDQFSMPKVIKDGAEVCGVPVNKVGSRFIL